MSKFTKSTLTVDGSSVHMSVPFAKVDKKRRLVSGYATLDNIDTQGDIVLAEASAAAFSRARGNVREMHQPIAAGRIVDFREDEYFDSEADSGKGKFYRGIFVTAYVSEGAEDTWKKVLDGTLTGFSIGGEIKEATNEFVKEANNGRGGTVRFIKNYDLTELSLVDNPANQLANVFSIQKSVTGDLMVKGMVSETFIENVFVCKSDSTVVVKDSDTEDCPVCGTAMENAGWFESGENRVDKVSSIVSDFRNPVELEAAPSPDSEGGVEMGTKNEVTKSETIPEEVEEEAPTVEEAEEVVEVAPEEEPADEVSEIEETTDEAVEVVEVEDDELAIAKRLDELHDAITHSLESTKAETAERVSELEKVVTEATENFLTKTAEIESKINGLVENVETQKARLAEMESRVEKMNSSDAIKKSAELENDSAENNVQSNSLWNGAFSPGGRRSGFSVDDL